MDKEVIDLDAGLRNMPREEAVSLVMKHLNFCHSDAEFYVAMVRGEIHGDAIKVDDQKSAGVAK